MYKGNDFTIEAVEKPEQAVIEEIKKIDREVWGEGGISEWVISPFILNGLVVFGLVRAEKAAMAILFRDFSCLDTVYLFDFLVLESFRQSGIGERFFKELLLLLKARKNKKIALTVSPENEIARKLYIKKCGMVLKNSFSDLYGQGEDRLYLEGQIDQMLSAF